MTSPQPPYAGQPSYRQGPQQPPYAGQPSYPQGPQQPPYAGQPSYPQGLQQPPGAAGPPKKNSTVKVVAIVAAVVVVVCCGGGGVSLALLNRKLSNLQQATAKDTSASDPFGAAQPNSGTAPTAPTVSPSPTASTVVGKMGQAVDGYTFRFTVSKVKCGVAKVGSSATLFMTAKGQYCLVTVTVKNISDDSTHFWAIDASANGRDGEAYQADYSAMVWANYASDDNHLTAWNEIGAGDSPSAILVFDIPKNITLTNINLPDSLTATGMVSIAVA